MMSSKVMWTIFIIYTIVFLYGVSVLYQNHSKLERSNMFWILLLCICFGYAAYRVHENTLSKKDNKYIVVDEDGNEVDVRETIVPEMFAEEAKVVKDEDKKEN